MTNSPLLLREKLRDVLREFFRCRGYHEAIVPSLVKSPGVEPYVEAFKVDDGEAQLFLATSPEFSLKKRLFLLPKDYPGIFAITSSFRKDPPTKYHAREFTMLEWYSRHTNLEKLIEDLQSLLSHSLNEMGKDIPRFASYSILDFLDRHDILLPSHLKKLFQEDLPMSMTRLFEKEQQDYELFFDEKIRPCLAKEKAIIILHSYPLPLRALARKDTKQALARRAEAFYKGVELASGYEEESSSQEIQEIFSYCNAVRKERGLSAYPVDDFLIEASRSLENTAGMALGIERLLMLFFDIEDIQAFALP
ncbi:MAG: hypothetical protein NZM25_11030 [Leptospiraceae bacterium]|nr:hypothetical protein [Leptospiraceae bacterium]MDW8305962.1 amino acid--tRNA ligase-related protein [Leptospiraceae bacterium]